MIILMENVFVWIVDIFIFVSFILMVFVDMVEDVIRVIVFLIIIINK